MKTTQFKRPAFSEVEAAFARYSADEVEVVELIDSRAFTGKSVPATKVMIKWTDTGETNEALAWIEAGEVVLDW